MYLLSFQPTSGIHLSSLCSMKDKVKRARAKIALQGLENRQLKRLLAQLSVCVFVCLCVYVCV